MEVEINGKIVKVLSYFKYSGSCFSKTGGQQEDVKMKEGEGLKTFGAMKMMLMVGSFEMVCAWRMN